MIHLSRNAAWAFLCTAVFLVQAVAAASARAEESGPRIISLYAAHTEVLLRLGARDNIIGVSRQETYDGPETENWHPPVFTIRDDVEKFLAAKPDIVLARPQHLAGAGHLRQALEKAGITVKAIQVTDAAGLYDYWRELAALVGRGKEAEQMISRFDAEVAAYRKAAEAMPYHPGVFLESIHREIKTFTPDSIPVWVLELAGGRNIAADAEPASPGVIIADYGPERLLAKADEIDIFISQEGAMNKTPLETVRDRPLYRPIKAFKTGNVHKIPEELLSRPTPTLLQGLRTLAEWTGLRKAPQ